MEATKRVKIQEKFGEHNSFYEPRVAKKTRLNLNDLLKRRQEEKKIDKKTNRLILSGAAVAVAFVLLALSL